MALLIVPSLPYVRFREDAGVTFSHVTRRALGMSSGKDPQASWVMRDKGATCFETKGIVGEDALRFLRFSDFIP